MGKDSAPKKVFHVPADHLIGLDFTRVTLVMRLCIPQNLQSVQPPFGGSSLGG